MFKKTRCPRCDEKIKKDFDFCPYCGTDLNNQDSNGFLGKNDFDDMKLPFGFNALLKPLMRELDRQMAELDKELRKDGREKPNARFSIHIGTPGQKPINLGNSKGKQIVRTPNNVVLPKISDVDFDKIKKLPRVEPKTNIRRLSDRVIYEINLVGVKSIRNVNINRLEASIEIKAFSDKEVFVKDIEVGLPLVNYVFSNEILVLEFALK